MTLRNIAEGVEKDSFSLPMTVPGQALWTLVRNDLRLYKYAWKIESCSRKVLGLLCPVLLICLWPG